MEKGKGDYSGLVFVGILFIGIAFGFIYDSVAVGTLFGLGFGFIGLFLAHRFIGREE